MFTNIEFLLNFHKFISAQQVRASKLDLNPVADPDLPEVGAPTLGAGGVPTYDFAKFSKKKMHEIERIWTPLDPPMRSTKEVDFP